MSCLVETITHSELCTQLRLQADVETPTVINPQIGDSEPQDAGFVDLLRGRDD